MRGLRVGMQDDHRNRRPRAQPPQASAVGPVPERNAVRLQWPAVSCRSHSGCKCTHSAERERAGPARDASHGQIRQLAPLARRGRDLSTRRGACSLCVSINPQSVQGDPYRAVLAPRGASCLWVWSVYYKQIRKSEQRPPLHLRAAHVLHDRARNARAPMPLTCPRLAGGLALNLRRAARLSCEGRAPRSRS